MIEHNNHLHLFDDDILFEIEVHAKIASLAQEAGMSMNAFVKETLKKAVL